MSLAEVHCRREFKRRERNSSLAHGVLLGIGPGNTISSESPRVGSRLTISGGCSYVLRGKIWQGVSGEVFQADEYESIGSSKRSKTSAIKTITTNYIETDIMKQIDDLCNLGKCPDCSKLIVCYNNYYKLRYSSNWKRQNGFLYIIIMEFMRGGDLLDFITYESETASISRIVDISIQMAESVALIHKHNILHRDINPNNYLLGDSNNSSVFKLGGFRLSRDTGCKNIATVDYIAPEILDPNTQKISHAGQDDWSLGVSYLMLWVGCSLWDIIKVEGDDEKAEDNSLIKAQMLLCKIRGMSKAGWEANITPTIPHPGFNEIQNIIADIFRGLLQRDPKFRMTAATATTKWKEIKKLISRSELGEMTWIQPEEAEEDIIIEEVVA